MERHDTEPSKMPDDFIYMQTQIHWGSGLMRLCIWYKDGSQTQSQLHEKITIFSNGTISYWRDELHE